MSQPDLYQILQVSPDADAVTITRAYRELAMKWHPDRNFDHNAPARFKRIKEAYDVLSDPGRRAEYDRLRQDQASGDRFAGQDIPSTLDDVAASQPSTNWPARESTSGSDGWSAENQDANFNNWMPRPVVETGKNGVAGFHGNPEKPRGFWAWTGAIFTGVIGAIFQVMQEQQEEAEQALEAADEKWRAERRLRKFIVAGGLVVFLVPLLTGAIQMLAGSVWVGSIWLIAALILAQGTAIGLAAKSDEPEGQFPFWIAKPKRESLADRWRRKIILALSFAILLVAFSSAGVLIMTGYTWAGSTWLVIALVFAGIIAMVLN